MTRIALILPGPSGGSTGRCSAGSSEHSDGASTAGCTRRARRCPTTAASARDVLACSASCGSACCAGRAGNFVSNYHWACDGIGPKDRPPCRPELAWGGRNPPVRQPNEYRLATTARGLDQVGAGHPDARSADQAGQLRDERLERWEPGCSSTGWPRRSTTTRCTSTNKQPAATTTGPTCCSRTCRSRDPGQPGRSIERAAYRQKRRRAAADRLRVERLVPADDRRARGTVQPLPTLWPWGPT